MLTMLTVLAHGTLVPAGRLRSVRHDRFSSSLAKRSWREVAVFSPLRPSAGYVRRGTEEQDSCQQCGMARRATRSATDGACCTACKNTLRLSLFWACAQTCF